MLMKEGLGPVVNDCSRILILGSLPGNVSLKERKYYANPRNHFWQILSCIYDESVGVEYETRLAFLRKHEIALWDVLKAAERRGSLDSGIRSPVVRWYGDSSVGVNIEDCDPNSWNEPRNSPGVR